MGAGCPSPLLYIVLNMYNICTMYVSPFVKLLYLPAVFVCVTLSVYDTECCTCDMRVTFTLALLSGSVTRTFSLLYVYPLCLGFTVVDFVDFVIINEFSDVLLYLT